MHVWGNPWDRPDPRVSRVRAELGGIEWVGRPHSGPCFLLQSLTGWWGGGAVTGGAVAHPHSDSGIQGDVSFHGRIITLRGKILTDNGGQQLDAIDDLTSIFSERRWVTMTVEEPERGLARRLEVAPVSIPEPTLVTDTVAEVSLTVESASFPLLDVVERSVVIPAGGVDLTNDGTYRADLLIQMHGYLSTPGLDWSGGHWTFDASVGAGKLIEADLTNRKVSAPDTGIHYRQYAKGTWLRLPPGTTRVRRTGTGAGTVTAVWRSAWS